MQKTYLILMTFISIPKQPFSIWPNAEFGFDQLRKMQLKSFIEKFITTRLTYKNDIFEQ